VSYELLSYTPALLRWRLAGPSGADLDALVAGLICAGFAAEVLTAREAYRVDGDPDRLAAIAEQVNTIGGLNLAPEQAPTDAVHLRSTVRPPRPYRRTVALHSATEAASGLVARAVDVGLIVTGAGAAHYSITGSTALLVRWMAEHVYSQPRKHVLAELGLTEAAAAGEDLDMPIPTVHVVLPPRRVSTDLIERNAEGQITKVVRTETDDE